jgi:hypothetical protein
LPLVRNACVRYCKYRFTLIVCVTGHTTRVATLQIATISGTCYLFRLAVGSNPAYLPAPLKNLLEDPSFMKVGVNVANDATRFSNTFGCEIANTIEAAGFALDHVPSVQSDGYLRRNAALLTLVHLFMPGKTLENKDSWNELRVSSKWEDEILDERMIEYAVLDAYATILVFRAILQHVPAKYSKVPVLADVDTDTVVSIHAWDLKAIGLGRVVHYPDDKWGRLTLKTKTTTRIVVRVTEVIVPKARCLYPPITGGDKNWTMDQSLNRKFNGI